jgi:hypothetical protein
MRFCLNGRSLPTKKLPIWVALSSMMRFIFDIFQMFDFIKGVKKKA